MATSRDDRAADPQRVIGELRRERDEALAREAAMADLLRIVNTSPGDLAPVFEAILDKAHRLCGATQGTLQLYDGTHFRAVATHGLRTDWAEAQYRPRPPTNSADHELLNGAPLVHYRDLATLAEETDDARMRSAVASGVRTILRVPFRREGRLLGYISAYREEVKPFSEQEIALLESFAHQAAIAIENARLLTETRQRTVELQESLEYQTATSDVLKVISRAAFDLTPVLEYVVETAIRLCRAHMGSIFRLDDGAYRWAVGHGLDPAYREVEMNTPILPGTGTLVGRVALEGRTVQIADAESDPLYAVKGEARLTRAQTMLGVPLLREGSPIGVIAMARDRVEPFSDNEIALVTTFADQAVIAIENARLINETREALEQQTATAEVLGVINSSPGDLMPVFEAMVEKARHLCNADSGHLALPVGDDFRTAAVAAASPELEAMIRAVSYAPGRGTAVGRALAERRAVQIADIGADAEHAARHAATTGMIRTILAVPLLREGEPIGAFGLSRTRVEPFTDRQIALVENFAAQAVIAIENARLITETRQRTVELQESLEYQTATSDVLKVIGRSTFDLQPVLDTLVQTASRLLNASFTFIANRDGDLYRPAALHSVSPEWRDRLREGAFPADRGTVLGRAALEGRVVQVDDIATDPEHAHPEALTLGRSRTVLGVPLIRGGETIGVLVIARQHVEPFTERQIELVRTFADQAVIAIENARLITETRQRTVELQEALSYQTATGEVLRIVASSPDRLAPVLEAILERATELCGVKAGNLYLHDDGTFRAVAARHPDPKMVADMLGEPRRPGPGTAIHRAFSTRMPVHIPDIADDDAYGAGNTFRMRMVERGVRAVLIVPLVRGDEAIGAVTIYRPVPEPYSDAQIELVRTFADQAVVAIENARLFGELREARDAAEAAYRDLQAAQSSLVQAQKMAALGQLTAGIAHEIKNPLNFVNNFAGLSTELLAELKEDVAPTLAGLAADKREAVAETIAMLTGNLDKIAEHGRRADNIVKSMLEHSRGASGEKRVVDLNGLIDEAFNLAYHGARAQDQSFNIALERDYAKTLGPVELAPQEMTRVFLNLFGNGFYATHKRAQANGADTYRPTLHVATCETGSAVEITIRDNGTGIPAEIRDRLFQPFFTTKPTGEGTGLGLSISYDIVTQQHGGTIAVASEEGAYTEFTIRLPRQ